LTCVVYRENTRHFENKECLGKVFVPHRWVHQLESCSALLTLLCARPQCSTQHQQSITLHDTVLGWVPSGSNSERLTVICLCICAYQNNANQ
jgi:hypothetical protein